MSGESLTGWLKPYKPWSEHSSKSQLFWARFHRVARMVDVWISLSAACAIGQGRTWSLRADNAPTLRELP